MQPLGSRLRRIDLLFQRRDFLFVRSARIRKLAPHRVRSRRNPRLQRLIEITFRRFDHGAPFGETLGLLRQRIELLGKFQIQRVELLLQLTTLRLYRIALLRRLLLELLGLGQTRLQFSFQLPRFLGQIAIAAGQFILPGNERLLRLIQRTLGGTNSFFTRRNLLRLLRERLLRRGELLLLRLQ